MPGFGFTPAEDALRHEVRAFIRDEPPEQFACQHGDLGYGFGAWSSQYLRRLGDKGWLGLTWPREIGGQGRSARDLFLLFQELAYGRVPAEAFIYTQAVGYSIFKFGNEQLIAELIPGMLSGRISVAEALSEPNSGSDLLSLGTSAIEDGDSYVLDGQKTWISNGWMADYALTAARTDLEAPRHKGISVLMVDLNAPGVVRRPILDLAGEPSFSEIFLEGVRIPKHYLVGVKNRGLQQILDALEWDRFWGRCVKAPYLKRELEDLVSYCKQTARNGKLLWEDVSVRRKLGGLAVDVEVCDALFLRALSALEASTHQVGHAVSMAKLFADELGQRFFECGVQLLGLYGQLTQESKWTPLQGRVARGYLSSHGVLLAGGTPEIQRITIATRGLGLPRS